MRCRWFCKHETKHEHGQTRYLKSLAYGRCACEFECIMFSSAHLELSSIITFVRHKKSPVRQQNAWFDTKKPGSTQKCPVRHKNALPSMHQLTLPLANILPPPPPVRNIFFQFHSNILLLRTNREMKMKLYWYEFKISIFKIMKIEM